MSNKTKTFGHMEIELSEEVDILPDTIKRTFHLRNNHLSGKVNTFNQIYQGRNSNFCSEIIQKRLDY